MPTIDRLIRSRRKTIALIVERDGTLTVRAPRRARRVDIEAFVNSKAEWVQAAQAEARRRLVANPPHRYLDGESFPYLGHSYPLRRTAGARCTLDFDGQVFCLPAGCQQPGPAFERWYRQAAREVIGGYVERLARQHGYAYTKIRISGARTRWGSCSSRGSLNFAWRLVLAAPELVEYVVIHELVHLQHPNHSRAFWQRVSELLPDYAAHRRALRDHPPRLEL